MEMSGRRGSNTGIPGLSFSWKRAVGLSAIRQKVARGTGIPTTRGGLEKKIGRMATKGCLPIVVWLLVATGALVATFLV